MIKIKNTIPTHRGTAIIYLVIILTVIIPSHVGCQDKLSNKNASDEARALFD